MSRVICETTPLQMSRERSSEGVAKHEPEIHSAPPGLSRALLKQSPIRNERGRGTTLRILHITRKYPPMKGGMEEANFQLSRHLSQYASVELLSWGGSQRWLPLVCLLLFFKAICTLMDRQIDTIHTGDALLSPLTRLLKVLFNTPVTATVYGLDVTWHFPLYQPLIVRCLNGLDRIVCISEETKRVCLSAGVEEERVVKTPLGVDPDHFLRVLPKEEVRAILSRRLGVPLADRAILLSVGRFVRRKGFHWFVNEVLPSVTDANENVLYVLVGYGPLATTIQEAVFAKGLTEHFLMVDDALLLEFYGAADVFVMPNIPIEADMEGFGIVALEAAASGLPLVASRLEGIQDAIVDGVNGILVEPLNQDSFVEVVTHLLANGSARKALAESARSYTIAHFSWDRIAQQYYELLLEVVHG